MNDETKRIIERIQKLLARADASRNDNANEREIALRQAQKLMDQHSLSMSMVDGADTSADARDTHELKLGQSVWKSNIVNAISKLYGCCCYRMPSTGCTYVVGREAARATVHAMATYVIDSITREARRRRLSRSESNSWRRGAAAGVWRTVDKLVQERARGETVSAPGQALALRSHYEIELTANRTFAEAQFNGTFRRGRAAAVRNAGAYHQGHEYGRSIGLNSQIGGTSRRALR